MRELNEVSLRVTMKVSGDSFSSSSCQFPILFLCKFFFFPLASFFQVRSKWIRNSTAGFTLEGIPF